jgi:hypothetical protein
VSPFTKRGEREVWSGSVISVAQGTFVSPSGVTFERDLVHHPGAVSVVPVDGDEAVLVRQYRAAVDHEVLEIPAGKRDVADEPPEVTARRPSSGSSSAPRWSGPRVADRTCSSPRPSASPRAEP